MGKHRTLQVHCARSIARSPRQSSPARFEQETTYRDECFRVVGAVVIAAANSVMKKSWSSRSRATVFCAVSKDGARQACAKARAWPGAELGEQARYVYLVERLKGVKQRGKQVKVFGANVHCQPRPKQIEPLKALCYIAR